METTSKEQNQVKSYFENGDNKKGLLLFGPTGTGKTTAIRPYTSGKWAENSVILSSIVQQNGRGYLQKYSMHDMIIDDLGREDIIIKSYGDEISVMHDLIIIRYNAFQNGYKTHITTNLSFKEITDRYGEAIADRIKEMCQVIEFKGESMRA